VSVKGRLVRNVNDGVLRKYDIEACGFEGEGARHEVPEQFRSFFAEHRHRVDAAGDRLFL
jgi:hypothetical protein